jgi:hypothetical protein
MSHDHADQDELSGWPESAPTAEELRGVVEDIANHYPPPRLGTELVLLEVSPHRAHAYWNIDVEDYQAAQKKTGLDRAPLVLRLYDTTDGTPPEKAITAFDVEVQGLQGHWYLDLWKDGRTHVADLGFRDAAGRLVQLARSNSVSTPAAAPSPDYHTQAVDTSHPAAPRFTDLIFDPHLSPENMDVETGAPLDTAPDVAAAAPVIALPPSPAEPAPATVAIEPSRHEADGLVPWPVAPASPPPEKVHDEVQAYFDRAAEQATAVPLVPPWQGHQPVSADAPALDPARALPPEGWPSAETLEKLIPPSAPAVAPAEPAAAPSEPVPTPAPAPPPSAPAPVPLDQYVGFSSFEQGRREVALEINVELHIHGRAKPGTELSLYGQPVPLRPDGTFSIRKPLPQGAVVLPLLAVDPPAPASEG